MAIRTLKALLVLTPLLIGLSLLVAALRAP